MVMDVFGDDTIRTMGAETINPRVRQLIRKARKAREVAVPHGTIESVDIQGFKSLERVSLKMSPLNVLVGGNGAGKSNFLNFFDMMGETFRRRNLRESIAVKGGGAGDVLFNGPKHTRTIRAALAFRGALGRREYNFALWHTGRGRLVFKQEEYRYTSKRAGHWRALGSGHEEPEILVRKTATARAIREILRSCVVYHFHDTSDLGPLKMPQDVDDIAVLRDDGRNLAPILLDLRENHPRNYAEIVRLVGEVIPAFGDFELESFGGKTALRWIHKNKKIFLGAGGASDGTLRFMVLTTLFCMPPDRVPGIVFLDEPELGLHPYAISLLAALIRRMSVDKQVIVATQSPHLLNHFAPENIIVAEMDKQGATSFKRLDAKDLIHWLENFQLGELWQKNVIGGNPQ